VLLFAAAPAVAFNAAEETSGPLKVRIEAPAVITSPKTAVRIVIENTGSATATGIVRLLTVDQWRVEPEDRFTLELEAGGVWEAPIELVAGDLTYNAHYALHLRFFAELDGLNYGVYVSHVYEVKLENPPRPERAAVWAPIQVSDTGRVALWGGVPHRAVLQIFGEEEAVILPIGWQGTEDRTRATLSLGQPMNRGGVHPAIAMHPPWYNARGTVLVEFPLTLPDITPIELHFAAAMRDHGPEHHEAPSDGVTFRVRVTDVDAPVGVLGDIAHEVHTAAMKWEDAVANLSPWAGKSIRLQLESHPGPNNNTTCDGSYWGAPTLVVGAPIEPTGDDNKSIAIGKAGEHAVHVQPGMRGLLDGRVSLGEGADALSFAGFAVVVDGQPLATDGLWQLTGVEDVTVDDAYFCHHRFESPKGAFTLVIALRAVGDALRADVTLEDGPEDLPWDVVRIEEASFGPWNRKATRVYAGLGNVIENPQAFTLGFDGHQLASSFVGFDFEGDFSLVQALDEPPLRLEVAPDSGRYTMSAEDRHRWFLIPASSVWEGVKVWRDRAARPAAPGIDQLAGRFVFDLWGGRYGKSTEELRKAFLYGLTDAAVIWHNWQFWGYDYRLPDIIPANPKLGTDEEFKGLVDVCKSAGVLFAPHDNYIDIYPDAEKFSYDLVAFNANRAPVPAWLNEGRGAQSYRWRADAYQPFMKQNLRYIGGTYGPDAYFIDVFSSIRPYGYWTRDGAYIRAGQTQHHWGETFDWIREHLGGDAPQISESGHDQLIGYLEGAQANHLRVDPDPPEKTYFTWPVRCGDAERIPWLDAAYHDSFILHGAGYSNRYSAGLDPALHGMYSDDYMSTEVLTGHPAMVSRPFGADVVRTYWLLHGIGRALAGARIEDVEFAGDDIHRQHVVWDQGEAWVNRGSTHWQVAGHTLPKYGFYARAGDVETAIEILDGQIAEWTTAPGYRYVNGRARSTAFAPLGVHVADVAFDGNRAVTLQLAWRPQGTLQEDLTVFVHGCDAPNSIRFQGDHAPTIPTSAWQGTVTTQGVMYLPDTIRAGESYGVYVGLYSPGLGWRYPLDGREGGTGTLLVGQLHLIGDGANITDIRFEPAPVWHGIDTDLAERINVSGQSVDFGAVQTAGACRIVMTGTGTVVMALPGASAFTVVLAEDDYPALTHVDALDETGAAIATEEIIRESGYLQLRYAEGVFAYRLR
jgi:hypothetical protein